jgi:catechol 2,3-dioxygenase-like lactoylglutathione lyase family enzyme
MRPLESLERAVLAALTDEFMSTSVIKIRAGISSTERNETALRACMELERRDLAERAGSGLRSTLRWRRTSSDRITETPGMNYRCDHVHLRSKDAVAAANFYVETFGAREIRRDGSPVVSRVTVDLGGLTLFIEQAPEAIGPSAEPPHLGIEHIGLAVDDIEATMIELRRRNVTIVSGITDVRPGLHVIFIDGPDAVRIELLQRSDVRLGFQ